MANKRFGDARRHHREAGVLGGGDRLKAVHDAPDRAEQADERRRRPDRREKRHKPLDPLHLAADGHVHHPLDALLQAGAHDRGAEQPLGGAAPPFAHRRRKHRGHRIGRALADALVEVVERAARPEALFKAGRRVAQAAQPDHLVEDDRPRPERGQQQDQHDDFDDGIRLQEQRGNRQIMGDRTSERQGVDGRRRHSLNLLWRLLDDPRHRPRPRPRPRLRPRRRRHGSSSASPASGRRANRSSWAGSAAGIGRSRWRKASRVSMRPRGVRWTNPSWIR